MRFFAGTVLHYGMTSEIEPLNPLMYHAPMQISGIGIDLAEKKRFRQLVKKQHLLDSLFSKHEQTYCFAHRDPIPHLAGTFAAKEAVVKTGAGPFRIVEIRREEGGKPYVRIGGRRSRSILVSISHAGALACAIAIRKKV